jgi:ABC-type phosphate transport system permease subunit
MDFDKTFKRTIRAAVIIWVLVAFFTVAFIFGVIFFAVKAVKAVEQYGLKNTIERVWEGPSK